LGSSKVGKGRANDAVNHLEDAQDLNNCLVLSQDNKMKEIDELKTERKITKD
jgi:hypothetical protein